MKIQRRIRRAAASTLAALTVVASALVAAPPASAANGGPCDFAVLIGVRGFTAPGGTGTSAGGYGWTAGGYGDVPQAVVNKYNEEFSWPTYEISLNYDAGGVTPSHVWNGAQNLANEINWYANNCTYGPAILLTGHSLGAAVIVNLLVNADDYLTAKARSMVRSVQLYGNPLFYAPGRSWSSGTYSGQGIISALSSAASNEAATASINSMFGTEFIEDNCYAQDGYCQAGKALDGAAHNSYTGGAATLGGYSLGERLIIWSRGAEDDGEAPEYSLPAPGSGELPNLAFITPSNADEYAVEIEEMTQLLEDELQ